MTINYQFSEIEEQVIYKGQKVTINNITENKQLKVLFILQGGYAIIKDKYTYERIKEDFAPSKYIKLKNINGDLINVLTFNLKHISRKYLKETYNLKNHLLTITENTKLKINKIKIKTPTIFNNKESTKENKLILKNLNSVVSEIKKSKNNNDFINNMKQLIKFSESEILNKKRERQFKKQLPKIPITQSYIMGETKEISPKIYTSQIKNYSITIETSKIIPPTIYLPQIKNYSKNVYENPANKSQTEKIGAKLQNVEHFVDILSDGEICTKREKQLYKTSHISPSDKMSKKINNLDEYIPAFNKAVEITLRKKIKFYKRKSKKINLDIFIKSFSKINFTEQTIIKILCLAENASDNIDETTVIKGLILTLRNNKERDEIINNISSGVYDTELIKPYNKISGSGSGGGLISDLYLELADQPFFIQFEEREQNQEVTKFLTEFGYFDNKIIMNRGFRLDDFNNNFLIKTQNNVNKDLKTHIKREKKIKKTRLKVRKLLKAKAKKKTKKKTAKKTKKKTAKKTAKRKKPKINLLQQAQQRLNLGISEPLSIAQPAPPLAITNNFNGQLTLPPPIERLQITGSGRNFRRSGRNFRGSCGGNRRDKFIIFEIDDILINAVSVRQRKNTLDCGIASLIYKSGIHTTYKNIRTNILKHDKALNPNDILKIADNLKLNVVIFSKDLLILASNIVNFEEETEQRNFKGEVRKILFDIKGKHYYFIDSITGKQNEKKCVKGCVYTGSSHICPLRSKHFNPGKLLEISKLEDSDGNFSTTNIIKGIKDKNINFQIVDAIAGMGKSYLILPEVEKYFIKHKLQYIKLSTTGLSSAQIGGQTIHRFLNLKEFNSVTENLIILENGYDLGDLKCIIIDEFARLNLDLLKMLDVHLRHRITKIGSMRCKLNIEEPFGGIQILFMGDTSQTGIKTKEGLEVLQFLNQYQGIYYNCSVTKRYIEKEFIEIVKLARLGKLDEEKINLFETEQIENVFVDILPEVERFVDSTNTCTKRDKQIKYNHILTPTNSQREFLNNEYIKHISKDPKNKITVKELNTDFAKNTKIIIIKNDYKNQLFNGQILLLKDIIYCPKNNKYIIFRISDIDKSYKIRLKLSDATNKINCAFALTIAKIQGVTLQKPLKIGILTEKLNNQKSLFYTAITRCQSIKQISFIGCGNIREKIISAMNNIFINWSDIIKTHISDSQKMFENSENDNKNINNPSLLGGYEKFYIKRNKGIRQISTVDLETLNYRNKDALIEYSTFASIQLINYSHKTFSENSKNDNKITFCSKDFHELDTVYKKKFKQETYLCKSKDYIKIDYYLDKLDELYKEGYITYKDPLYIQSFNGSSFDYQLIFSKLLHKENIRKNYIIKQILANGKIKQLILTDLKHRPIIIFHDIFLFLNTSLKKACKSFINEDMQTKNIKNNFRYVKGEFPHALINSIENRDIIINACFGTFDTINKFWRGGSIPTKYIILTERDIIKLRAKNELKKVMKFLRENKIFNPLKLCEKYVENDVIITNELYKQVNEKLIKYISRSVTVINTKKDKIEKFDLPDILDFPTITAYINYVWRLSLTKYNKYMISNPKNKYSPKTLKLCKLNKFHYDFALSTIYGGRSIIRCKYWKCKHNNTRISAKHKTSENSNVFVDSTKRDNKMCSICAITLDFKGMYASCMLYFNYSLGICHDMETEEIKELKKRLEEIQNMNIEQIQNLGFSTGSKNKTIDKKLFDYNFEKIYNTKKFKNKNIKNIKSFSIDCEIIPNKRDIEPSIARRDENNKIHWDVNDRRQCITDVDLYIALSNGWEVGTVYSINYFRESDKHLAPINKLFLDIKKVGEDNKLSALRSAGKLCSNAMFGSALQKNYSDKKYVVNTDEEFKKILENENFRWRDTFENKNGSYIIIGDEMTFSNSFLSRQNIFIGSYTLSYSRLILDRAIKAFLPNKINGKSTIPETIIKGDTDSLTISRALINKSNIGLIKPETGFLTDEIGDDHQWENNKNLITYISEIVAPCAKVYDDKYNVHMFVENTNVFVESTKRSDPQKMSTKRNSKETHMFVENTKCSDSQKMSTIVNTFSTIVENGHKTKSKGIHNNSLKNYCFHNKITTPELFKKIIFDNATPNFHSYNKIKKWGYRLTKKNKDEFNLFDMSIIDEKKRIGMTKYKARDFTNTFYEDDNLIMFGYSLPNGYDKEYLTLKQTYEKNSIEYLTDSEEEDDEDAVYMDENGEIL